MAVYLCSDGSFELFPCWKQLVSPKETTCFRHRHKSKQAFLPAKSGGSEESPLYP